MQPTLKHNHARYDANGNVATKTDARSITTTYSYDALNRPTGATYSNSDPALGYTYDSSSCLGLPACYNVGRRTGVTDAAGSENFAYDTMGREWAERRTTNSVTKNTSYTYYLDGSLSTLTYPSGHAVTYTTDSAGRPSLLQSGSNYFALGTCANGATGSNGICYAPQGAAASLTIGQYGGFAGVNLSASYNNRLQPNEMKASLAGGTVFDLSYGFVDSSSHNNGNVIQITNSLNGNRSQQFTYDQVNRILTAQTPSGCTANCWSQSFSYDQWGNLLQTAATGIAPAFGPLTFGTNNQITSAGFTFDAAGNELTDVTNTYDCVNCDLGSSSPSST